MSSTFSAHYISLTENSVRFLRNRFPYKEITSAQIHRVELTKGTDLKRPVSAIVFGVCFVLLGAYLIVNFSVWSLNDIERARDAKTFGYFLILQLFLVAFGSYAIYAAAPIHPVARFTLVSGGSESLSINDIIKEKRLRDFLICLKKAAGSNKVFVNRGADLAV